MELINRIRKSRKGFTLVEIIVVLVILAILAAFTIPSMLGFVTDARNKAHLAEAREVYVAAQAAATEVAAIDKATAAFTADQKTNIKTKAIAMTDDDGITDTMVVINYSTTLPQITSVEYTPSGTGAKKITVTPGGAAVVAN